MLIHQNTNNQIRFAIITDDPPIRENMLGWGMYKVNTRLFKALQHHIAIIISGTGNLKYNINDIDEDLKKICFMNSYFNNNPFFMRILKTIYPIFFGNELIFLLSKNLYLKKIQESNANWIFCPCGSNPLALWRGVQLSEESNLPVAVYLVDDFLAGAEIQGNSTRIWLAKKKVNKWLKHTDQIFVISQGLQQRIYQLYNVESTVLNLPYDFLTANNIQNNQNQKNQILFLGNLSSFYLDGLKDIARSIDYLNTAYPNLNLTLRFTMSNISTLKKIIGDYSFIQAKVIPNSLEFSQELNSSLFCFAPYSFDEKYRAMVSTSFPSKMLDYLAFARSIVVYGPDYSTSVKYFKEFNLDTVITQRGVDNLKDVILSGITKKSNHSMDYNTILIKNHNPQNVALKILDAIKVKTNISKQTVRS